MSESLEVNTAKYSEVLLSSLSLPDDFAKLIKRIIGINGFNNSLGEPFFVETVADIISLDPYEFSKCQGIGRKYVDLLINFKKDLPLLLAIPTQKTDSMENIFILTDYNYSLETPIDEIAFLPKYQKLIKRIVRVIHNIKTVKDVIDIDVGIFRTLPYVGQSYVDLLVILQKNLLELVNGLPFVDIDKSNKELPSKKILSKIYINYGFLNNAEVKLLKKLDGTYFSNIDDLNVNNILSLDKLTLSKLTGFGGLFAKILNDLQNKIKFELLSLNEGILERPIKNRCLFTSSDIFFLDFSEIDSFLIEDVESYLFSLDDMKMDIALSRWGYNQNYETLEEIGCRHNLTRERIRQFEKGINLNFTSCLRLRPKVLWANIREKMTQDLTALLPNLAKCFSTEKLFYDFIELCCQVENGSISKIIFTKIDYKIVDFLFSANPSPIAIDLVVGELMSNYGYGKSAAINGIKQLEKKQKIEINNQGIYPKRLGIEEAVAHALTFYPEGLPWKDIARIINQKGYSLRSLSEENQAGGRFSESNYIYLCAKGTYRNLIFLDINKFDIPKIMRGLLDFFDEGKVNSLNLHDYFYRTEGQRTEIDYFILRHLVREYGEDYGVYFNGKSSVDSVSLDKESRRITQVDVIIEALQKSKFALTKQEIAERLRSKSIAHAGFYLDILINSSKVVRIDNMVYTTPEKAFANIDVEEIMRIVENIMDNSQNIVEADVFREYINIELDLSYSKYIYAALVKTKIISKGWYCNNMLFSKNLMPYKSLADMCDKVCRVDYDTHQNVEIVQSVVWITDTVAISAVRSWKQRITSL